jgi:hypothetical protein
MQPEKKDEFIRRNAIAVAVITGIIAITLLGLVIIGRITNG